MPAAMCTQCVKRSNVWKGSAFGGARGRIGVPKIVDIDDPITLTTPLDKISDAFELLRGGKLIRSVVVC